MLHGELVGLLWLREDLVVVSVIYCCTIFALFACKKLRKWITATLVHVRSTLIIPHPHRPRPPVSFIFFDPTGSSICLYTTIVIGAQHNLLEVMPDKFEEMLQRWNEATVDEVKSNYLPEEPLAVEVRTPSPPGFHPTRCVENLPLRWRKCS